MRSGLVNIDTTQYIPLPSSFVYKLKYTIGRDCNIYKKNILVFQYIFTL